MLALLLAAALNQVPNGDFETLNRHGWPEGWMAYGTSPGRLVSDTVHSGKHAFFCDLTQDDPTQPVYGRCSGVRRYIDFDSPDDRPIYFGCWSKAENCYCGRDYESCLSVGYADGTWDFSWSLSNKFAPGTHDWQLVHSVFYPKKPVKRIVYYAFIRKGFGKAWFDDLFLERRDPGPIHLGYRRMTMRPYADEDMLVVTVPPRETVWSCSVRGGAVSAGTNPRGSKHIEFAVPRSACELELRLIAGGVTNVYPIALPASRLPVTPMEPNDVCLWTASSQRKVTPLTYPTADEVSNSPTLRLDFAKRGAASGQLLLTTGSIAVRRGVKIEIDPVTDAAGNRLKGSVRWNPVGFVERQRDTISQPESPDPEERWLPDPLMNPVPFDLLKGATQPVWLTFTADADAKSGEYRTVARAVTEDGLRLELPVEITVHDFELPRQFGMKTSVAVMEPFLRRFYPDTWRQRLRELHDVMLDNRINADSMTRWDTPSVDDIVHALDRGASLVNLLSIIDPPKDPKSPVSLWPDPKRVDDPAFYESLKAKLTPLVAELRKRDWMKYAYVYGFDERNQEHYAGIDRFWKRFRGDFPDLPVLTTARMYKDMALSKEGTNFTNAITTDWYCPITSVWRRDLSRQLQALGKQVWWYTCCGPCYPFANFSLLEEPNYEARVLGWQTWRERADGFLFWAVNWWTSTRRIDENALYHPGRVSYSEIHSQGDGVLAYAGEKTVVPSLRLTLIRDMVQDYEWLQLAERKLGRKQAEAVCDGFIRSMMDFDRGEAPVMKARAELGRLLE